MAACLALKQRPFIRYQSSSESAARLARELLHQIEREDQRGTLFDYRGNCQLLIMDRKSDPVTPLLMQWLYLGMVHEFMPITNNRVRVADNGKDEEFVLNPQTDDFLKTHKWDNFGDLCDAAKQQTNEFAAADKRQEELKRSDMASFVENFKDYKLLELSAKRHVSLVSELGRIVRAHGLTTISALEQSLACSNDSAGQYKELMHLIEDPNVCLSTRSHVDREGGPDPSHCALRAALRAEARQQALLDPLRAARSRRVGRYDLRRSEVP